MVGYIRSPAARRTLAGSPVGKAQLQWFDEIRCDGGVTLPVVRTRGARKQDRAASRRRSPMLRLTCVFTDTSSNQTGTVVRATASCFVA